MKSLFALAMKGRVHAIVAVAISAVMALRLAPLAPVSAGFTVLATLRNGAREGVLVVISAVLALAGLGGLMFDMPLALGLLGLMLWLPAWWLAVVLGSSGSLARTLEFAALGAVALVVLQYALLGDPATFWRGLLDESLGQHLDPNVVPEAQREDLLQALAGWMTGGVASSWLLSMALAVMFGRWGQALLDNPGAFGREFRGFRCSRTWLIALPMLLVPTFLVYGGEPSAVGQIYLVGMTLFLLQGISLAHAMVHLSGANKGWLFGLYMILLVGAPYSVTAIAAAGYADGWLNFRARFRQRPDGSQGPD